MLEKLCISPVFLCLHYSKYSQLEPHSQCDHLALLSVLEVRFCSVRTTRRLERTVRLGCSQCMLLVPRSRCPLLMHTMTTVRSGRLFVGRRCLSRSGKAALIGRDRHRRPATGVALEPVPFGGSVPTRHNDLAFALLDSLPRQHAKKSPNGTRRLLLPRDQPWNQPPKSLPYRIRLPLFRRGHAASRTGAERPPTRVLPAAQSLSPGRLARRRR